MYHFVVEFQALATGKTWGALRMGVSRQSGRICTSPAEELTAV